MSLVEQVWALGRLLLPLHPFSGLVGPISGPVSLETEGWGSQRNGTEAGASAEA